MKTKILITVITAVVIPSVIFAQSQVMPIPMKEFHIQALNGDITCTQCHESAIPTERPTDRKCIDCHGEMKEIAKLTAAHDRNPHASKHYGYNVACVSCHFEHKPSKALCNDCHKKYPYPKLK